MTDIVVKIIFAGVSFYLISGMSGPSFATGNDFDRRVPQRIQERLSKTGYLSQRGKVMKGIRPTAGNRKISAGLNNLISRTTAGVDVRGEDTINVEEFVYILQKI